jgi:hypothetical protein
MVKKLRNGIRRFVQRASASFRKVDRARVRFKKRHPQLYRIGKKAVMYGVESSLGPEGVLARGAYNAYKGRNRGFSYQAKNAARTGYKYYSARGLQSINSI